MFKVPKKNTVRSYELTYLAPASFTDAEQKKLLQEVTVMIEKQKGKIVSSESWGKKHLAYLIKANKVEHTEAVFQHLVIELPTQNTPKLERALQLNTQVVRNLIVVAEDLGESVSKEESN